MATLADRLLALHVRRRLVVTQSYEFRMAQMVHVGPVRVLDLATSCGFSQRHSAILSAVRPLAPPALLALGQVRSWLFSTAPRYSPDARRTCPPCPFPPESRRSKAISRRWPARRCRRRRARPCTRIGGEGAR